MSPAVWKKAVDACKDLQPPGALSGKAEPGAAVGGPQVRPCVRENGVKDFPDPVNGEPLVDTTRIPSSDTPGGMTILNAAMHKCGDLLARQRGARSEAEDRVLTGAAVLVAVAATGGVVVLSGGEPSTAAAQAASANTAKVQKGKLSAVVSQDGTLTYRARPDGSPFSVINRARGTYTELPEAATRSAAAVCSIGWTTRRWCCCAARSRPTATCAWATRAGTSISSTATCTSGLRRPVDAGGTPSPRRRRRPSGRSSTDKGLRVTGALGIGDAVFLPEAVRIATVTGELGGSARPGARSSTPPPTRSTCR